MKGRNRFAIVALSVAVTLALVACALNPLKRGTPDDTATRHRIQSADETATARARDQGQGGEIGDATPTAGKRTIASSTPTPTPQPGEGWRELLPAGEALFPPQPIAAGISEWDEWLQPGSSVPGKNSVEVLTDSRYGSVVQFARSCGCADGGAAGLVQATEIGVSGQQHLYVWLVARVDAERGGNIGNTDPRWFPEGAVQVRLKYTATNGEQAEWYHGFYVSDLAGVDAEHFDDVATGHWVTYLSDDLAALSPRPATIDEVRLYGFGWEFTGAVAEFALVGSAQVAP